LAVMADSDALGRYNKMLLGKFLVVFEELDIPDGSWTEISARLKRLITSKWEGYSDKYEKKVVLPNVNNFIVNTNTTNAIKHADGRRYYFGDVSLQNHQSWLSSQSMFQ